MNRKTFVHAASWTAASLLISTPAFTENASKIKAIAFDAFAYLTRRKYSERSMNCFPGKENNSLTFGNPGNLPTNG